MTTTNVALPGMYPEEAVRLALGANSSHPADILRAVINDLSVLVPATDNEGGGAVTAEVIADVAARLVVRLSSAVDAMGVGRDRPIRIEASVDPWAVRVRVFVRGKQETTTDAVLAQLGEAPLIRQRRRVASIMREMGWTQRRSMIGARNGSRQTRWVAPGYEPPSLRRSEKVTAGPL